MSTGLLVTNAESVKQHKLEIQNAKVVLLVCINLKKAKERVNLAKLVHGAMQ